MELMNHSVHESWQHTIKFQVWCKIGISLYDDDVDMEELDS